MTATTRDTEGDLPEQPVQTPDSPEAGAPAVEPGLTSGPDETTADPSATPSEGAPALLMNAPSDRCRVCAAEMAHDQHYCLECGTRRGKPRFALAKATAPATVSTSTPTSSPLAVGWTRTTALLAIVIVLLALGIGVIIGNAGSSISQPVKVQITGGALSTAGSAKSSSTKASKSGSSSTGSSGTSTKPAFSVGS